MTIFNSEPFSPIADDDARWDAIDSYEVDQMADHTRRTPFATRDLIEALALAGVTAYVTGTGGGCEALEIPLSERDADGFQDEILVTALEDSVLPYLGSGFGATLYLAADKGDPFQHGDPIVIEATDAPTMARRLLAAIETHNS